MKAITVTLILLCAVGPGSPAAEPSTDKPERDWIRCCGLVSCPFTDGDLGSTIDLLKPTFGRKSTKVFQRLADPFHKRRPGHGTEVAL